MTPTKKTAAAKKPAARRRAPAHAKKSEEMEDGVVVEAAGKGKYAYAVGRRKTATATTKLWMEGDGSVTVNGKDYAAYFPLFELREQVMSPLKAVGLDGKVTIAIRTSGGGLRGQAEASRHGISRALLVIEPNYRGSLKALGMLTRDPREKERKKPGLKKARKASQWAKR
jgi:small subunit ribosomal protein S9